MPLVTVGLIGLALVVGFLAVDLVIHVRRRRSALVRAESDAMRSIEDRRLQAETESILREEKAEVDLHAQIHRHTSLPF